MTPDQIKAEKQLGPFKLYFGWHLSAGLVRIVHGKWHVHLLVQPGHWMLGHHVEAYDQSADYWGAGPLLLVVKQ